MQINAPTTEAAVAPNFEYRPTEKILQAKSFAVRHLRTTADMIKTVASFMALMRLRSGVKTLSQKRPQTGRSTLPAHLFFLKDASPTYLQFFENCWNQCVHEVPIIVSFLSVAGFELSFVAMFRSPQKLFLITQSVFQDQIVAA